MSQDRVLVQAVLAREAGAFERLVRDYQGLCWHIVYRMVRHPEDARELCQDTFLRVYRYLHQYRHESSLKSWIGQIAFTVALRHLERRRIPLVEPLGNEDDEHPIEQIGDGFDLEAACADDELRRHLYAAMESLPPLRRTVLTLYHLDELSIPDIATITGLAEGTIKSHLFRSRRQLRGVLESRIGTTL
jgi:RNA polymerase sigma-70 factor (ECF subfamily)